MKILNFILLIIKKNPLRGRAFLIKNLTYIFPKLEQFSYNLNYSKKNLVLNLKDSTAINLFLNDKITHEQGLLKLLVILGKSQKTTFWDIGCNYGFYPFMLQELKNYNKILCFEPNPNTFKCLQNSFRMNKNIYTYNFGIGSKSDNLNFYYNKNRSDLGSFVNGIAKNNINTLIIPIKTIDEIINKENFPDLLKIDVEGFETEVLKGFKQVTYYKPIIILEWITLFQEDTIEVLIDKYFDTTWKFYYIDEIYPILYKEKNKKCGSDILIISIDNKYIDIIKCLITN